MLVPYNCDLDSQVEIMFLKITEYFQANQDVNNRYESSRASENSNENSLSFFQVILKGLASGLTFIIYRIHIYRWRTLYAQISPKIFHQ